MDPDLYEKIKVDGSKIVEYATEQQKKYPKTSRILVFGSLLTGGVLVMGSSSQNQVRSMRDVGHADSTRIPPIAKILDPECRKQSNSMRETELVVDRGPFHTAIQDFRSRWNYNESLASRYQKAAVEAQDRKDQALGLYQQNLEKQKLVEQAQAGAQDLKTGGSFAASQKSVSLQGPNSCLEFIIGFEKNSILNNINVYFCFHCFYLLFFSKKRLKRPQPFVYHLENSKKIFNKHLFGLF